MVNLSFKSVVIFYPGPLGLYFHFINSNPAVLGSIPGFGDGFLFLFVCYLSSLSPSLRDSLGSQSSGMVP